jgi:hypothetical protein
MSDVVCARDGCDNRVPVLALVEALPVCSKLCFVWSNPAALALNSALADERQRILHPSARRTREDEPPESSD